MPIHPDVANPDLEETSSRYVVGIDLGTTNCAVCYVDTQKDGWQVRTFKVPQLVAAGQVESRHTLPSFHFEPAGGKAARKALQLPWSQSTPSYVVGFMARDEGATAPGRLIASAKSWLCHGGVDRTAELLPWHGAEDVQRLSPVQASSRYLQHIRDAWNARFSKEPLAKQDIVLTLPASFDEVARELTIQAAAQAELPRVVLIEEPQAAFYAWIHRHEDDWDELVKSGQTILICDVGGGTTDFTLICVKRARKRAKDVDAVHFYRVAVGNHLILGGDNLDLALARHVEQKISAQRQLDPRQWDVLVRSCRQAKESLLSGRAPTQLTINLPGSGSRVIGGSINVEVDRDDVRELLLNGFLPQVNLDEKPLPRQSGFQEFGLPYATDPAITRYLAAFLSAHRDVAKSNSTKSSRMEAVKPDVVLLNGGFFASPILRERFLEVLTKWFRVPRSRWSPVVLDNPRLELAVAEGAAYYGMVRRGDGLRISANLARSYYISVEGDPPTAVCLVSGDAQPGDDVQVPDRTFELLVSQPVEFPLLVSSTRLNDRPGDVVAFDHEEMTPLPPIRTVLRSRRRREQAPVPVHVFSRLTEIGTVDLWCKEVSSDRSWRLQFDIRSTTRTDLAAHDAAAEVEGYLDESIWKKCEQLIVGVFGSSGSDKPGGLVKRIARALEMGRADWPPSLLRRMWDLLLENEQGRRKSAEHEARWLNLLGYALRPGYGLAIDDWRVAETWRAVRGSLAFHVPSSRNESLILWRRIAGGLSMGQQMAIAEPLLSPLRGLHTRLTTGKSTGASINFKPHETIEMWRLLGSLEMLNKPLKNELGEMILQLLPKRKLDNIRPALSWTLGRLGQRVPTSGPLNTVLPVETAMHWLSVLTNGDARDATDCLAVMQLARRTNDRYRDVTIESREAAVAWLSNQHASPHLVELVRDGGELDSHEQGQVFSESLPKGLRLRS